MAKKNKWDEYLQFDDWKKDDGFEDEVENIFPVEQTKPREIQGLGISKEEESFDLSELIAGLNAQNKDYFESAKEDELQNRKEKEALELQALEEEKAAKAQAVFEKERAEREAREFARQEAEAKRVAGELEKKQNSLLNKAGKALGRKAQKSPGIKEGEEEDLSPVAEGTSPEITWEAACGNTSAHEAEMAASLPVESQGITPMEPAIGTAGEDNFPMADIISHAPPIPKGKETVVKERQKTLPGKKKKSSPAGTGPKDNTNPPAFPQEEPPAPKEGKTIGPVSEDGREENRQPKTGKQKGGVKKSKQAFPFLKKSLLKEQPQAEMDWKYVATHDEMTGLFNRTAYEQAKKEERDYPYAVIYIDANNLKYLNDTIGHEAGDALLIGVASQIEEMFPGEGYRIGGDEFVVVTEDFPFKKADETLSRKKGEFHKRLDKKGKASGVKGVVMSASFGYAFTDGGKSFHEVEKEAEQMMYTEKAAYKKANPKYDMRRPESRKETKAPAAAAPTDPEHYDETLSKEQRELKGIIKGNHVRVSSKSTQDIVREIQSRAAEVVAILVASPTFDHLFIIQTVDAFIDIIKESDYMIDYSYLYIIYQDCPVYKGSDEYLKEVTSIFEGIGNGLRTGKIRDEKDLLKVKGINIFKNIYV